MCSELRSDADSYHVPITQSSERVIKCHKCDKEHIELERSNGFTREYRFCETQKQKDNKLVELGCRNSYGCCNDIVY